MTRPWRVTTIALAVAACGGRKEAPTPAPSAAPSTTVVAPEPPKEAPRLPAPAPSGEVGGGQIVSPARACRAISVKGAVTLEGGEALVTGAVLDHPAWLDVAKGGRLAVKHAVTGRELIFDGPARLLPCERGEERFLVTRGRIETAVWAGARPGAEVILATPLAVVRYGDAKLDVTIDERGLAVRADTGDAWIDGPSQSDEEQKVTMGTKALRRGPALEVKALVERCLTAADAAAGRAKAVLAPTDKTPLGTRAAEHVRARQAARTACAVARAALGAEKKGPDRDALDASLDRGDARWRGMP